MSRMLIFFALFLSIYGSMHLYVLVKTRRAFHLQYPAYLLIVVMLAFLMLAPIQARVLESQHYATLSIIMAWIGNVWMGALFFFICLSLPLDGYHIGLAAVQQIINQDLTHLMLSRRQRFALASLAGSALMIYGAIEAHRIKPEVITIKSNKIPPDLQHIRIVQISDLHIGPMTFPARIGPVVEAIKIAQPDILVSTGDLVDGAAPTPNRLAAALYDIPAPLGKFAVTGNHEYYTRIEHSLEFTRQAGFTLLHNNHVRINKALVICGVDDPGHGLPVVSEREILADFEGNPIVLFLKHRPLIDPLSLDRFDLQLSGHTHKGQIFPFSLLINMLYRWDAGTFRVSERSSLHVNRGSGTWGPPFRLLAPPEITVIDLIPETD